MKKAVACSLAMILMMVCGCSSSNIQSPIAEFRFSHRGSSTGECYTYRTTATDSGADIVIETNAGSDVFETKTDASTLEALHNVIETHGIAKWNGFDKSSRRTMDGTGFTLYILFEDGSMIEAKGSNKFPKTYGEAQTAICAVFEGLIPD